MGRGERLGPSPHSSSSSLLITRNKSLRILKTPLMTPPPPLFGKRAFFNCICSAIPIRPLAVQICLPCAFLIWRECISLPPHTHTPNITGTPSTRFLVTNVHRHEWHWRYWGHLQRSGAFQKHDSTIGECFLLQNETRFTLQA